MESRAERTFKILKNSVFIFVQIFFSLSAFAWMPTAALTQKRLSLVAGNPGIEEGYGFLDGTGTAARFYGPSYLAIDSQDNIYVSDTFNNAIRKITPSGIVTTFLAGAGAADGTGWAARFSGQIQGLTIDSSNNIYVADASNNSIRKITPAGVVTTLAGPLSAATGSADGTGAAAQFNFPNGVVVDKTTGTVYVADTTNHAIRQVTSGGVVTTLAGLRGTAGSADGTGASARFKSPQTLVLDSSGNLLVLDTGNHSIRKVTPGGVVTTVAGTSGQSGSVDGTGSAARFSSPQGLAIDGSDNLWVGDYGNNTIRKVTATGVVTTFAGAAGQWGTQDGTGGAARFNDPKGLAFDSHGNLFVVDYVNGTIRKITPAGVVTTFAGMPSPGNPVDGTGTAARVNNPRDVAIDASGNLYVSEQSSNTIRKITAAGVISAFVGTAGLTGSADGTGAAATFKNPGGLAIDSLGNILVADTGNSTIRKITPAGVVTTFAGVAGVTGSADGSLGVAKFYGPSGIAIDNGDNTYVADVTNNNIRKITPGGVVSTLAGKAGTSGSADGTGSAARFTSPYGVAVNAAGTVYVADWNNHTIRAITPAGVVTTLAGLYPNSGVTDGTGSAARFVLPEGITLDSSGNLFVADYNANNIRKVTPAGVVTTVAGSYGTGRDDDGNGIAAGFTGPVGLRFDSSGNLFIATGASNIRKMTPAGDVTHFVGYQNRYTGFADGPARTARFNSPRGMIMDASGNLFVADMINKIIRKITPSGVVSTFVGSVGKLGSNDGTGAAAEFNAPSNIAMDSSGNFFVANTGSHTIRKITPAGVVTTFAGLSGTPGSADGSGATARFNVPTGIAVDSADNVFVADSSGRTIRKITAGGVVSTFAGTYNSVGSADGTGATARFNTLSSMVIDSSDNLYVVDQGNSTIRKITPSAVVTTYAGVKTTKGFVDGALGVGKLSTPSGIAIDKAGYLYVADTDNNAIRKIDLSGNITTVIGGTQNAGISYLSLPANLAKPTGVYSTGGKLYITTEDAIVVTPNP